MAPLFKFSFYIALGVAPCAIARLGNMAEGFVVYGFSQSDVNQEDPQVYELQPDITIRAIGKWSTNGDELSDYNFEQIHRYHEHGIKFMGSGTASIIFPHDFRSQEDFDNMSTKDANGDPVPHDEFGFEEPARRGNVFNPAYREYLLSWAKIQVDGGVDGVNFDEWNAGFSGGKKYDFNGNEGFDDFAIADFTTYLLQKYPNFTADNWVSTFKMDPNNIPKNDVPNTALDKNFNYRTYLRAHGWNKDPLTSANPLAAEWGRVTANRMYADDSSFTATYLRRFWKQMIDALRSHAETVGQDILISSNGLIPYVDFNSVGMYPWNPDEQTADYRGANYVPVEKGRLQGSKSLKKNYMYLKTQSALISGPDVPVAVFIDWPSDMMTDYLNLPLEDKKDYWRIFGAEAYANGLFPAFHLKDTVGSPSAKDQGILDFLVEYSGFYKEHAQLFVRNRPVAAEFEIDVDIAASLLEQADSGRLTIHLVNHKYNRGISPVNDLTLSVRVSRCPEKIAAVSPDGDIEAEIVSCNSGKLEVLVGRLEYSVVLSLLRF
jgi:hypothetical protein